ncbi:hypothetical protein L211DRAFT_781178, partial [Terfezia boudieri ATCC MYA-4762]
NLTDSYMFKWGNEMSREGGKSAQIGSFMDPSLGTNSIILTILSGIYADYSLVPLDRTDEDAYLNAKLSISIARKIGAAIWLIPEDICPVRSRLIVTFVGSLMATYEQPLQ